MDFGWLEITVASLVLTAVIGAIWTRGRNWLDPVFWKRFAIVGSLVMFIFLWILTFDTLAKTRIGTDRVPSPTVINYKITYEYDADKGYYMPVIHKDEKEPLFGKEYTEEEAMKLLVRGKLVIQSRACMDCHTLLGNGAYYAPDLTKAWLDPKWEKRLWSSS